MSYWKDEVQKAKSYWEDKNQKAKSLKGFKVKFEGRNSSKIIINKLIIALQALEQIGVEEFGGVNLYLTLFKDGEKHVVTKEDSSDFIDGYLDGITHKNHNDSSNIENYKIPDYLKECFLEKEENIINIINEKILYQKELHEKRMEEKREYEILRREKRRLEDLEIERKKRDERLRMNQFKEFYMKRNKILNSLDFNKKFSTITKLVSKSIMKKYIGVEKTIDFDFCFRVGIKNENGKIKSAELYDPDFNFICLFDVK